MKKNIKNVSEDDAYIMGCEDYLDLICYTKNPFNSNKQQACHYSWNDGWNNTQSNEEHFGEK